MLIITFFKHENINAAIKNILLFVGLALIVDYYKDNFKVIIKCLLLHFELCIYLNLATIYFLPNGLYLINNGVYRLSQGYLLGWHHLFLVWEFPALLVSSLHRKLYGTRKRCFFLYLAIILCEIPFGGSTGLIGTIIFIIMDAFPFLKKYFTPYRTILVTIGLVVIIVFLRKYDFLEPIIVQVLNGDMTFTGRLVIWDNAIDAILKNPIFGYGLITQERAVSMLGFSAATHCHNQILQILLQGGIIGLCLFTFLYYINISECKNYWGFSFAQTCSNCIVVFTIIGITEPFEYPLMYLTFILPYHLNAMKNIISSNSLALYKR